MYTVYSRPESVTVMPSVPGWRAAPATPSLTCVSFPQPASSASATAHTAASVVLRARTIGSRSLLGGGAAAARRLARRWTRRVEARGLAEAGRLDRLPARDRDPPQGLVRGLLEDHPQPLERLGGVALYPPAREVLLDRVDGIGGL